jgi:tetratricopeptide (TPR) repeat protein
MKKTTAILSFTLLAALVLCAPSGQQPSDSGKLLSIGPTCLWAASPPAPQEKKPQWKSRDEYDAYQAIVGEQDPNKKIQLAQAFLEKFKDSDFKDLAYLEVLGAYLRLGDGIKAVEAGQKALEANPDNLDAQTRVAYLFPFAFRLDDPDVAAKLSRAESDAKRGLEVLQKAQKPENVTEDQFNQRFKASRAVFNSLLGFVGLQRKDYAGAVTSLKAAAEDNPSYSYGFYWLGLSYLNLTPRDYDNAVWNMARAISLAKAARDPNADPWEKYLRQTYIGYHGNDQGLADIVTQAASSSTPPEGFKVGPMEVPKETGNKSIDAFNQTFFQLKFGGERAQKLWDGLKGEPFGVGGYVENVEKGTEPGVYLVRIDVLEQSRSAEGMYDIELRDSTQPNVKNLSKGDAVHFKGTISAYTATPNLVITLDSATINDDEIPEQPKVAPKPKPKPRPRATTPARRPPRKPPG